MKQLSVVLAVVVNNDFKAARIITTREERVRAIVEREGLTVEVRELDEVPGRQLGWYAIVYRTEEAPDFNQVHGYSVLAGPSAGPNMAWLKASVNALDSSAPIGTRFYCAAALLDPVERATLKMTAELEADMSALANEMEAQVLVGVLTKAGLGWLEYRRMGTGHIFSAFGLFHLELGNKVVVRLEAGNSPNGANADHNHAWASGMVLLRQRGETLEEVLPFAIRTMAESQYMCPFQVEWWHGDHKAVRLLMELVAERVGRVRPA